jgi:hypothetical protein
MKNFMHIRFQFNKFLVVFLCIEENVAYTLLELHTGIHKHDSSSTMENFTSKFRKCEDRNWKNNEYFKQEQMKW